MWPLLIAAATAAAKAIGDKESANNDKMLQAETARFSPWTGLKPQAPKRGGGVGSLLQGGLAGLSLGQGLSGVMGGEAAGAAAGAAAPKYGLMPDLYGKSLVDTSSLGGMANMGGGMNGWGQLAMMQNQNPNKFGLGVNYNF